MTLRGNFFRSTDHSGLCQKADDRDKQRQRCKNNRPFSNDMLFSDIAVFYGNRLPQKTRGNKNKPALNLIRS
jgi:hypothetical protein